MKFARFLSVAALLVALLGTSSAARALTVIATNVGLNQPGYCLGVATQCGNTFGQTFTVTGETQLDTFDFNMAPVLGGSVDVVFRLYEWSGTGRTGPQVFASDTTTLSNGDWATITWDVGRVLKFGESYIAYLDASGLGNTDAQRTGFSLIDDTIYQAHTFLWERVVGDGIWNANGYDTEFRAVFSTPSAVPLPATALLILTGVGGLGLMRRRTRR